VCMSVLARFTNVDEGARKNSLADARGAKLVKYLAANLNQAPAADWPFVWPAYGHFPARLSLTDERGSSCPFGPFGCRARPVGGLAPNRGSKRPHCPRNEAGSLRRRRPCSLASFTWRATTLSTAGTEQPKVCQPIHQARQPNNLAPHVRKDPSSPKGSFA
jgi:hypothetical protein